MIFRQRIYLQKKAIFNGQPVSVNKTLSFLGTTTIFLIANTASWLATPQIFRDFMPLAIF